MSEETTTYQVDVPLASGTVTVEVEYFAHLPRPSEVELFFDAVETLLSELELAKLEFCETLPGFRG